MATASKHHQSIVMYTQGTVLHSDFYLGTSPSGVQWIAKGGRDTVADVAVMILRLQRLGGEPLSMWVDWANDYVAANPSVERRIRK